MCLRTACLECADEARCACEASCCYLLKDVFQEDRVDIDEACGGARQAQSCAEGRTARQDGAHCERADAAEPGAAHGVYGVVDIEAHGAAACGDA